MNEESMKTIECAAKARKSVNTIIRWIKFGYRGQRLPAERSGWDYRVNPNTFDKFLCDTAKRGPK